MSGILEWYRNGGPIMHFILLVGIIVAIWWQVSAKNRYTGPVRTIDEPDEVTPQPEPPAPPAGAAPTPAS